MDWTSVKSAMICNDLTEAAAHTGARAKLAKPIRAVPLINFDGAIVAGLGQRPVGLCSRERRSAHQRQARQYQKTYATPERLRRDQKKGARIFDWSCAGAYAGAH
jgi:hypothetical protein